MYGAVGAVVHQALLLGKDRGEVLGQGVMLGQGTRKTMEQDLVCGELITGQDKGKYLGQEVMLMQYKWKIVEDCENGAEQRGDHWTEGHV